MTPDIHPLVGSIKTIGTDYFRVAVEDADAIRLLNSLMWGQQNWWHAYLDGIVTTEEVVLGISFHVHNFFVAILGSEFVLSDEELAAIIENIRTAFSRTEDSFHRIHGLARSVQADDVAGGASHVGRQNPAQISLIFVKIARPSLMDRGRELWAAGGSSIRSPNAGGVSRTKRLDNFALFRLLSLS